MSFTLNSLKKTVREFDREWMKEAFKRGGREDAITNYDPLPMAEVMKQQEEALALKTHQEGLVRRTEILKELLGDKDAEIVSALGTLPPGSKATASKKESGFDKLMKNLTLQGLPMTIGGANGSVSSVEGGEARGEDESPMHGVPIVPAPRKSVVQGMTGAEFLLKYNLAGGNSTQLTDAEDGRKGAISPDSASTGSVERENENVRQHMRDSIWGGGAPAVALDVVDGEANMLTDTDVRTFFGDVSLSLHSAGTHAGRSVFADHVTAVCAGCTPRTS